MKLESLHIRNFRGIFSGGLSVTHPAAAW